jgi:hypothetical protein
VGEQAAQQVTKQGPSKFDQALRSSGVEGVARPQHVEVAQQVQRAQAPGKVDQLGKLPRVQLDAVDRSVTGRGLEPVARKAEVKAATGLIGSLVENIEKSQGVLDKLIDGGLQGKTFSNTELISLQAGMYKYSQELDLCSKVVEKATGGLKDTLKTQV